MPSLLDGSAVNLFRGSTTPEPAAVLVLTEALDAIQHGTYQRSVQRVRSLLQAKRKADYDRAKRRLDAVTFGGTFSPTRAKANLTLHTGIVHGDLDHLTDLDAAKHTLTADPHVLYCFISPSGTGLKVGVRVEPVADDDAYKRAWQAVADAHQQDHGLTWDPSGKDVCRLCYVSWDPELYRNQDARRFPVPPYAPPPPKPQPFSPLALFDVPRDRRERYAQQAIQTAVAMIDSSTPGNRHFHRLKASELLGGYIAGGILTEADAYAALEQAVERNTNDVKRSMKTIASGLSHGQARPITLKALEAERQAWLQAHPRTSTQGHHPSMGNPWEGMQTLPIRPYTGYRGLRYRKVMNHG
jgi:hypothetical protein